MFTRFTQWYSLCVTDQEGSVVGLQSELGRSSVAPALGPDLYTTNTHDSPQGINELLAWHTYIIITSSYALISTHDLQFTRHILHLANN